ncbi:MAG: minichromosome maintenance protein MCM [Candidatus Methanomethylicia archaeon]|nr:minichromosome maintenance protein MCM [Candidatus Methanomethylicia archaeon]MCX8168984.1 minichromosome maintenance protein MCM [Candidatus Methanomethylicia archaeon]MDW7988716.1 minichromosome maintenance protein MCM [Nitrososphaerota archaeon]
MSLELLEADIREKMVEFFNTFKNQYYRKAISQMAITGQKHLVINFEDLLEYDPKLAEELIEYPSKTIAAASAAIYDVMSTVNISYARKVKRFSARFKKLPEVTPIRKIRSEHAGKLIMIEGILTRVSSIKQRIIKAAYRCDRCSELTYVEAADVDDRINPPERCTHCGGRIFKLIIEESEFIDWQRLTIQERPEELPPAQLPRSIEAIARGDLVDIAKPGDRVVVTGILKAVKERGSIMTFIPEIEVNYIEPSEKGMEEIEITPEDEEKIKKLAKDPMIHEKILQSIAPSIYGYREIKEGIAYLLFGGIPKVLPDGVRIRGDINILLVGDPGTAKSQLLQYVARIAPRGIYTSGKGSTAAGLTAAVVKDRTTGDWYLEAGALILADGGVACIDEIDKMRSEDRVAIHEAMEQQTVSIAKAGIVATLNARTSILASANPTLGRFVEQKPITENVNLPITILSRFDLIFPIKDEPDEERDLKMSEHILRLHQTRGYTSIPPIEPELLKKYVAYMRRNVKTKLSDEAMEKIKKYYVEMRRRGKEGSIPITPRQLEALVRMTEARAKMALREIATEEDADAAIRLMNYVLERTAYDVETESLDIDMLLTGKPKSQRDKMNVIMDYIKSKVKEVGGPIKKDYVADGIEKDHGIPKTTVIEIIEKLLKEGILFEARPGYIMPT